jgi:hypothetical protein
VCVIALKIDRQEQVKSVDTYIFICPAYIKTQ